ncbi:unnamed protein product [Meloidogyne enterolobii]|uniref:Uncharacterized protein n=1 Tax=Meloidogyne enterolobii TaxID=390850 RepID=A0ACB1AIU4_MELEN
MTYVHRQRYGYAQYFGPKPQQVHCPTCNQNTTTKLKYVQLKCLEVVMYILFVVIIIVFGVGSIITCTKSDSRFSECFMLTSCGVLSLFFFMSICVPFLFCDSCKHAEHYCSVCNTFVGKYVNDDTRPVVILPPELYKHEVYQPNKNV